MASEFHSRNILVSSLTELLRTRAGEDAEVPGGKGSVAAIPRRGYTFLKDESASVHISYGELDRRARAVAAVLAEDARPGDRVLLLYPPGIDFLAGFFGSLYAGLIPAPLPLPGVRGGLEKLALVQQDTGAALALTSSAVAGNRAAVGAAVATGLRFLTTDRVDDALADSFVEPRAATGGLAYLQYTSGSTSAPRGVMVAHANVLHNLANIDGGFQHTADSVIVTWLPHFHDMGLIYGLLAPLYHAIPCCFMSPAAFVQRPLMWLGAITKFRATHSGGPNFAYDLCVRRIPPEERPALDLSSWEIAFNGAEPIHAETLDRFSKAFASCGFRRSAFDPAYGLAEASLKVSGGMKGQEPVIFAASASALARNRVETAEDADDTRSIVGCGRAGLDTKVLIVDPETAAPCPPGEVGEIRVAGPGVAQGYWRRPEETERTFGARLAGSAGGHFLRTGDLGFLRDGELFVAGRLKDLIIIRGLNHHPSDIELTARRAHPGVATSIAAAFAIETDGNERLVLVMEAGRREPADPEQIARSVRQAVSEKHEVRVYAFVLAEKGGIPKTSSGKIQRRLCRSMYLDGKLNVVFESVLAEPGLIEEAPVLDRDQLLAARDEERHALVMTYLRNQLAKVLETQPGEFAPDRPITSYGADSLMAMEIQNRVEADLGVRLAASELIEGAAINDVAARILGALADKLPAAAPIRARGETQTPLSFEQERLWLLDQLAPGNPAYHIPFAFRVKGPLDVAAIEAALSRIVKRQASLRTVFAESGGRLVALVTPAAEVKIEVSDLTSVPRAEREDEALELAGREIRKPFDLGHGPLYRFRLYRLGAHDHLALLVMHHIVSDVWSVRLLLDELLPGYQAARAGEQASLEPLPIQYGDFAAWQREQLQDERLEELLSYWRERLEGAPILEMPADRPRPPKPSFEGGSETVTFPRELAEAAAGFCRNEDTTLFTVLLAAFEVLATRCTGQVDVVLGTTNANRNRPELERLIGFFAAPLVVRSRLSGDPGFREVVARVRKDLIEAYAHQELPFSKVVEAARPGRRSSYTPLFRVMFSVLRSLLPAAEMADAEIETLEVDAGATDFDLFINIVEEPASAERAVSASSAAPALLGLIAYSKDLYNPETIRTLIAAYLDILGTAVRSPKTRLSEFALPETLAARKPAPPVGDDKPVIAVTATFTSEPVEEIVAFWMRELGFDYRIRFAPYNQVFQQLLDPASLMGTNRKGVNLILVRLEDWAPSATPSDLTKLEETVRSFIDALSSASLRASAPLLVCLCPASPEFLADGQRAAFARHMEELIASGFAAAGSVHVVRSAEFEALYPVGDYYDAHGDRLGHVPYTSEFFAALGSVVARRIHAMRTAPYKVIALDCDQTLWQGVCGEDGPEGVVIDPPRRALQQFMAEQHDAGMLLAIVSKNNEDDVRATFAAHPEMPLHSEHFVSRRINWDPKCGNLRDLARELDLGLDSLIFVDDSPTECASVAANCPEVLTLQLPAQAARIPEFLRHVWAFDRLTTTEEDKKRTAMYGQRLERRKLQQRVVTLEEFLAALELKVEIGPMQTHHLPRVSQLTLRTNQMNLTSIRRSEAEIHEFLSKRRGECRTVHVSDRFGSYGLVGVMLFFSDQDSLKVDTFLLSCRALGRGVEHRMLAALGKIAAERGLSTVAIPFVETAKNRPALMLLRDIGAQFEQPRDGGFLYKLPAGYAAKITYRAESPPGEPSGDRSSARPVQVTVRSIDYPRIATEFSDAQTILRRVRAESSSGAASTVPYQPPRTPLERQLAEIWAEMLNVPKVGVNDNFFDLGGHSLLAVQLLSRVRETFHVDLSLDVVFTGVFSVAELAKAIEVYEIEQAGSQHYTVLLEELEGLSDEEVRALIEQEEKTRPGGSAT